MIFTRTMCISRTASEGVKAGSKMQSQLFIGTHFLQARLFDLLVRTRETNLSEQMIQSIWIKESVSMYQIAIPPLCKGLFECKELYILAKTLLNVVLNMVIDKTAMYVGLWSLEPHFFVRIIFRLIPMLFLCLMPMYFGRICFCA